MALRISVQSMGFSVASLTFEVASTFAWVVSGLNSCSEFILVLQMKCGYQCRGFQAEEMVNAVVL